MKWYSVQVHRMRGVDAVSGDIDGPHGEGRSNGQKGQPLDVGISVTPSRSSAGPNGGRVKVIMVVWYSGDCCGPLR